MKSKDVSATAEGTTSGRSEGQAISRAASQTASAVAETTASKEAKRRPLKTFREGDVSASVWPRGVQVDDKLVVFHSVSVERSYKDRDGQTRYTHNFDADNLGALLTVVQKAAEYILGLENQPAREPMPDQAE